MKIDGWFFIPAVILFFLVINFSCSAVKIYFAESFIYLVFFYLIFIFLRNFDLIRIFKPIIAASSLIVFIYGLIQKYFLFPIYLKEFQVNKSFLSQSIISRIQTGRIFSIFSLPTLYAVICAILLIFIFHYFLDFLQ